MWLGKASDLGNANAQYWLAKMYVEGLGVKRSSAKAAQWMKSSAEQQQTNAQAEYGWMLAEGRGVSKDQGLAIKYWRPAAVAGVDLNSVWGWRMMRPKALNAITSRRRSGTPRLLSRVMPRLR